MSLEESAIKVINVVEGTCAHLRNCMIGFENKMEPPSLHHPVFDNDLILDHILDYVINDKRNVTNNVTNWLYWRVNKGDVNNCRIVSKAWLRATNRVLRKCEQPLFQFHLREEPLNDGSNVLSKGNELVQFIESVTQELHLDHRVPPYSIRNSGSGAQPNASRILFDCLTNCGSGLIQLSLRLSDAQIPFVLNNNFSLPKLKNFIVKLHRQCRIGERGFNDMQDKIDFMQAVFHSSEQLKKFTLACDDRTGNIVPDSFGNLLLTSTITHLDLRPQLKNCHLQTLVNSSLPNLRILEFSVGSSPVDNVLITSILRNVQKTLQKFLLFYETPSGSGNQVEGKMTYELPLMEKLKYLYIPSIYPSFKLGGRDSSFQRIVPVLNEVNLSNQKNSWLRNWAKNVHVPSVTILQVSTVYEGYDGVNVDLATIQALHLAFPNVKELHIMQADTTDMTALGFIMKEMRNLRCLQISFYNYEGVLSSGIWDAVLTGIPIESLEALRESPDLWEGLLAGSNVSLRNLTELETLELAGKNKMEYAISEIAFHYAFLKMPKLTNLILTECFCTSKEMARLWESRGRSIETYSIRC